MSFNKIILVGNLGRDPELRYTPQGTPVCTFSLATNDRRKDKTGEMQDQTTWFRVTLWNRQAETASQYLQKGRPVYIEGRLRVEEYTDRDGKQRHSLEVTATDMQFIGSRSDSMTSGNEYGQDEPAYTGGPSASAAPASTPSSTSSASAPVSTPIADDDIPF